MIAVVPIRDGVLPSGADETIAECGRRVVVAGSGTESVELTGLAAEATLVELGPFEAARWASALAPVIAAIARNDVVALPASSDGRDLAPRLAIALDRPLFAGATEIGPERVRVARRGGRDLVEYRLTGSVVATLQPGVRGATPHDGTVAITRVTAPAPASTRDAVVVDVLPPDVTTMDLAEAGRIVGGGAGLDAATRFDQLERFASAIGATMGATRVVTDRSWVPHERQIGTTGVVVDPDLYVAFGISGAVQHTSGLGDPEHIISINTDAHCPMMQLSDLAVVSDANAVLDELLELLGPAPLEAADG